MTEQRNMYSNVAFGEGRTGHIQMRNGGEQAVKVEDKVVVNEAGIMMHHADEFDTVTFIPITNVAWVRTRSLVSNRQSKPLKEIEPYLKSLPNYDD